MKYKACWTRHGKTTEGLERKSLGQAVNDAAFIKDSARCVTILYATEPGDPGHPDNVGKFFLHQIVK